MPCDSGSFKRKVKVSSLSATRLGSLVALNKRWQRTAIIMALIDNLVVQKLIMDNYSFALEVLRWCGFGFAAGFEAVAMPRRRGPI
jgi:hypothetical protein